MEITDYVISIALILLVVRQIRGRKLTVLSLLWPIGLVGWAAVEYLKSFPLSGNNFILITACISAGLLLGAGCGLTTSVFRQGSVVIAKATGLAVVFWVTGMSGRLLFGLYAEHGGGEHIYNFSMAHHIAFDAWSAALISMALCEVLSRTAILAWKLVRNRPTKEVIAKEKEA